MPEDQQLGDIRELSPFPATRVREGYPSVRLRGRFGNPFGDFIAVLITVKVSLGGLEWTCNGYGWR